MIKIAGKMKSLSIVLTLVFLISSCGKSGSQGKDKTDAEKIVVGISPDNVDVSKAIPIADLSYAYFAWKGKKISVKGYCAFFFDEGSIGKIVSLVGSVGDKKKLIECTMSNEYPEKFSRNTPIVISGIIERDYYGKIRMKDCILVVKDASKTKTIKANPYKIDADKPVDAADFYKTFYSWFGKEITVTGDYWGTTTSTTSYGKTIRVDLKDPKSGKVLVGCKMKEEHEKVINRRGVMIKGRVSRTSFGRIGMTNCEFVNQK